MGGIALVQPATNGVGLKPACKPIHLISTLCCTDCRCASLAPRWTCRPSCCRSGSTSEWGLQIASLHQFPSCVPHKFISDRAARPLPPPLALPAGRSSAGASSSIASWTCPTQTGSMAGWCSMQRRHQLEQQVEQQVAPAQLAAAAPPLQPRRRAAGAAAPWRPSLLQRSRRQRRLGLQRSTEC